MLNWFAENISMGDEWKKKWIQFFWMGLCSFSKLGAASLYAYVVGGEKEAESTKNLSLFTKCSYSS